MEKFLNMQFQNKLIYIFILEFLNSNLKSKLEKGLIDTNNKDFNKNSELNKILEKVQKSNNIKYKKNDGL